MLARYAKFGIALVAVVVSFLIARFVSNVPLGNVEWSNIFLAATGATSVYLGQNTPAAPLSKCALALAATLFTAVNDLVASGVTMPDWWQLVVMAAGAIGVYVVPNGTTSTPARTA